MATESGKSSGGAVPAPKVIPTAMAKHLPCPLVMSDTGVSFGMVKMDVMAECHMATAVVNHRAIFVNTSGAHQASAMLLVPTHPNATISAAQIQIGNRVLKTLVIPNVEAAAIQEEQERMRAAANVNEGGAGPSTPNPYAQAAGGGGVGQSQAPASWLSPEKLRSNPFVFMLPFSDVGPGERVEVLVTYHEDLAVERGAFVLRIPTLIPDSLLPPGSANSLGELFDVRVEINAGTPNSQWGSASHVMSVESESESNVVLRLDKSTSSGVPNRDFEISYTLWNEDILTSLLIEDAAPDGYDQRSAFTLFVAPPAVDKLEGTFRRNVVFVIDRSGSMGGSPMQHTVEAANVGLNSLREDDFFGIIAFDDQMMSFAGELVPASGANVGAASAWLAGINARGLTDIATPLDLARGMLANTYGVPFIFLVTDGAVSNEQDICRAAMGPGGRGKEVQQSPIRIFTLGIGPYCNAYFLKMLATIGRGYSERVFHSSEIEPKMHKLLSIASVPVLSDVAVRIAVSDCEIYPFPIPDLFVGAPLVVSGKYEGEFPSEVYVEGTFPSGQEASIVARPTRSPYVPVNRIFIKQRLDLLTAQAWLDGDQGAVDEIVRLSVSENMPCEHTCMVLYEQDPESKGLDEQQREERRSGGAVGDGSRNGMMARKKKKNSNAKKGGVLAACAIGGIAGIVLLGAVAPSFGDVGATMGNLSVADAMGNMVSAFGDAFSGLGDAVGGAGEGGCCENGCCDACGEGCSSVFDALSSCCSQIGSCFSSLCESIGNCDACSDLGDCAGGAGDCAC